MLTETTGSSPLGPLRLVANETALVAVLWGETDTRWQFTTQPGHNQILAQVQAELAEYFIGTRQTFSVPLAPQGTTFQQQVWQALGQILYGQTRSYAAQAEALQNPSAVRAVGAANGRNPISILIPCHRVVGQGGNLRALRAA